MAITVSGTSITFNDATVQTTAATGASGNTITSSAVDITLTSSSTAGQVVTMTAANKRVILPSCTTMTAGPIAFVITNNGSYGFDVASSDGYVIAALHTGESVTIACTSTATANGGWATSQTGASTISTTISASTGLIASNSTSTAPYYPPQAGVQQVVGLTSTSFLVVYVDRATSDVYAVVGTISGTTISYGTPTAIYVGTSFGPCMNCVTALSSTAVFIKKGDAIAKLFDKVRKIIDL
jgi:hypothetical protein